MIPLFVIHDKYFESGFARLCIAEPRSAEFRMNLGSALTFVDILQQEISSAD